MTENLQESCNVELRKPKSAGNDAIGFNCGQINGLEF